MCFSADEALVWRGLNRGDATLVRSASLFFLAFAVAFWPFWIPFSSSTVEARPGVKRGLRLLSITGLSFGLFLFLPVVMHADDWLVTKIFGHSIQYDFATFPVFHAVPASLWHLCYLAIVSVPLMISGRDLGLRAFGAMICVSAALTQLAFWYAFVSVWCLFAAGLSVYLVYLFHRLPVGPMPTHPAFPLLRRLRLATAA